MIDNFENMSILTSNLYKKFNNKDVLKGLDFEAKSGEITLLAGRNGAGKTTWLRLALGLARPSDGSVLYDDKTCASIRESIAVVFDEPPVYPHLNGYQNLSVMTSFALHDKAWVDHIKQVLDLNQSFLNMKAKQYSLGQRRRLATAAALMRKPKYLFLDEPTVGLDPVAWAMVKDALQSLIAEKRSTIILTGQDFDEIEKLVDAVTILKDGVSVFEGSLLELTSRRSSRVRVSTNDYKSIIERYPNAKLFSDQKYPYLEIPCSTNTEAETVIQEVQKMDIKFQSLSICTDSLEEAFLAIQKIDKRKEELAISRKS